MKPLHNPQAEQTIIGCCLHGQIIADRLRDLRPDHFAIESHAEAYRSILQAWERGRPLDPLLLDDLLPDGPAKREGLGYWVECCESGYSPALLPGYLKLVRESATRRTLAAAAMQLHELAHGEHSAESLIASAAGMLGELVHEGIQGNGPRLIAEVIDHHLPAVGERWEGRRDGLKTGFRDLDDKLGGLRPGNLVLIAARPAMGKTALAMQISANVAEGRVVVAFSQEMADTELADRLIAFKGRVDLGKVIHGGLDAEEHRRFGEGVAKVKQLRLFVDDAPAQRIADIRAKSMKVRARHDVALVVVDYLQLMTGDGANRNAEIEQISRGLKALAKELGCPVIALSQLSRECEKRPNKRPMLSDLRDSGAIEQDADVVMMIYRDEVYNPDSPDADTAELLIRKNRQGRTGDVRLTWLGQFTAFADCGYQESRAAYVPMRRVRGFEE